jgi:biopolymer transport protein ExbB/TolQ
VLEEPANSYTRGWLVAVLDALLETLPQQMAIKEASGYLNEVLDEYPSWYRHVEELQNEERLLFLSLQALRDRLETSQSYAHAADRVRSSLRQWMTRLTAHHRHENRILQTAMNLEVGVGD